MPSTTGVNDKGWLSVSSSTIMRRSDAWGRLASALGTQEEGPLDSRPMLLPGARDTPVYPICQSTSACSVWATWRGMALSNRRLECLPVACQKPEPRERLALRRGRDDCHFWLHRVSLQGTTGSARAREEKDQKRNNTEMTEHLSGKSVTLNGAMVTFWNPVWRKMGFSPC